MYSFNKLKVCFVGIGSIASQHITNLSNICAEQGISLQIDALRHKGANNIVKYGETYDKIENTYFDVEGLPSDYDIIFITNPTDLHMEALKAVHDKANNFFIEKPIVSIKRAEEAAQFVPQTGKNYYVASPMRYKGVIEYIKSNVAPEDVIGVSCICSSYLPEWRPGTDYRKCYSAIKALGGGVSVDLIHEWDYLTYLFGMPLDVKYVFSKKSSLEMDVEDYAAYIAEYRDKMVELHLDYYGRASIRKITLFTGEDTIEGDLINNRINWLKSGKTISFDEAPQTIKVREMEHFLDIVDGRIINDNTISNAYKNLLLTQGII